MLPFDFGARPRSSFPYPVPVPGTDPLTGPFLAVHFSAPWLPYVLGALQQLLLQTTWIVNDVPALLAVQAQVFDLIALIASAECQGICVIIDSVPSESDDHTYALELTVSPTDPAHYTVVLKYPRTNNLFATPPISTSDTEGSIGDFTADDDYLYVKTAIGWRKVALVDVSLIIEPGTLPDVMQGDSYSVTFTASNGIPAYMWSVNSGVLPAGLTLNSSTGTLSGTPTEYGDFPFTIAATDSIGETGAMAYTLSVSSSAYADRLLAIAPSDLLAYWPLVETSGTTAINSAPTASGYDGVYHGSPTLANLAGPGATMGSAPLFDGTDDFVDVKTSALIAAFNGNAGTLSLWLNLNGAWSDVGGGNAFKLATSGGGDTRLAINKPDVNTLRAFFIAGSEYTDNNDMAHSTAGWAHVAMSWDKTANEFRTYINGTQQGTTKTIPGTWSGTFHDAQIGADNGFTTWSGWLGHVALWSSALTGAQVAELATAS